MLEELEFYAEHLMNMGVLLIVADFSDLFHYLNLLEIGQVQTLKLRPYETFIHSYLYNVSDDARTKTQACPLCIQHSLNFLIVRVKKMFPFLFAKSSCPLHSCF